MLNALLPAALLASSLAGVPILQLPDASRVTARDFAPVMPAFRDVDIVQLGESVHFASDIQSHRLALADALHETHGFDTLLIEGAGVDAWVAMEHLLLMREPLSEDIARARNDMMIPMWRTPQMLGLLKSVRARRSTERPFYVAAYDVQTGMTMQARAVPAFLETLGRYAPMPDAVKPHVDTLLLLGDRARGFPNLAPPPGDALEQALNVLEAWVLAAAPYVEKAHARVPQHARMLRMIPTQLHAQVELWRAHQADPLRADFRVFQETRDRLGAAMVMQLRARVSSTGRVMTWAHHVHVFHGTLGLARHSLGADLKRWMGTRLYTVGVFTGSGRALGMTGMEDVASEVLPPASRFGFNAWLAGLSNRDFMVNLRAVNATAAPILDQETDARLEVTGRQRIIPRKDYDGAIFIQHVDHPELPELVKQVTRPRARK